jgi:myo-inositol-1(or 4)-monophosphatase
VRQTHLSTGTPVFAPEAPARRVEHGGFIGGCQRLPDASLKSESSTAGVKLQRSIQVQPVQEEFGPQPMDMDPIIRVAVAAAYQGAGVLREHYGRAVSVRKKSAIDLVTDADTLAEARIIDVIQSRFPDHGVMAEESGVKTGDSDNLWIIDPLDGTTNFAHHLPVFAVSIAFAEKGDITHGVVLNPMSGELFTATRQEGARLNGHSIRVSSVTTLDDSLLVTGFPYNVREMLQPVATRFTRCLGTAQGIRRLGSAALDLCYVACGRFEGFWEENLKPWDTAAGMVIAAEAGATITDFSHRPYHIDKAEIAATNGLIHKQLLDMLGTQELEPR